ncbi:hypothetical protein HPB51_001968 [Rhipicephalus microplus]|uniref:Uncharacterized protein n=1 Tax=Rhipicephalus microplus TaxID=6941 RepID=A0A9J6DS40_RHIMP|nr:hypothetical protein HPB51_001968 [Rhipicephalus microplus]
MTSLRSPSDYELTGTATLRSGSFKLSHDSCFVACARTTQVPFRCFSAFFFGSSVTSCCRRTTLPGFWYSSTTQYSAFKAALLERTTASQRSRIQQFPFVDELGDHRPSHILCHMNKLMRGDTNNTEENVLR